MIPEYRMSVPVPFRRVTHYSTQVSPNTIEMSYTVTTDEEIEETRPKKAIANKQTVL